MNDPRKLSLIGLIGPTITLILAVLVKGHFAPLNAECNSAVGQFAQAQDTRASLDCGVDTLVFEIARFAFWGALAVGACAAAALVVAVAGGVTTLEQPAPSVRPPQRSAAVSSNTHAISSTLHHARAMPESFKSPIRCVACNAPNDVQSSDHVCYSCGASLAA
jgi:hypothetical protein